MYGSYYENKHSQFGVLLNEYLNEVVRSALTLNVDLVMVDSVEESSALDELAFDPTLNHQWETYWSEKGERIVWTSWVAKYQHYISSEYIEHLSGFIDSKEEVTDTNSELPELMQNLTIIGDSSAATDQSNLSIRPTLTDNISEAGGKFRNDVMENETDSSPQSSADDNKSADDGIKEVQGDKNSSSIDQHWQTLWSEHCEEQYAATYLEFMTKKSSAADVTTHKLACSGTEETTGDGESEYSFCREYNAKMNDLGLPTAFGHKKKVNRRNVPLDEWSISTASLDDFNWPKGINENKPKRKRPKKKNRKSMLTAELPEEIANDKTLIKYWSKRFSLFSLFDSGIRLDKESWFSVTPEKIAAHTASRCKCDIIVDAFCGAGGNTIQFAKTCQKVIAIDIDPVKIEMAKHNAGVYGVTDKIQFIVGSFLDLARTLVADAVFLSPPWGGPEYLKNDVYDIEEFLLPVPASKLMEISRQISPNICIYLPRNSNKNQLSVLAGPGNSVEVNQEYLGPRFIAITAYYGSLFKQHPNNQDDGQSKASSFVVV